MFPIHDKSHEDPKFFYFWDGMDLVSEVVVAFLVNGKHVVKTLKIQYVVLG